MSDEDIIQEYKQLELEALAQIREKQEQDDRQQLDFSWSRLINEGIKRRRSMDVKLKARIEATLKHRAEDYDFSPSSFESSNYESRR